MKKNVIFLTACFLIPLLQQTSTRAETITIVHLNDTHAHLVPFGPKDADGVGTIGGFARIYTIIDSLKKNEPNPILLHAGDAFVGDFMFNKFFGVPDLAMLRVTGFDAMTLGNHEFDLFPPTLITAVKEAFSRYGEFPLLSANLDLTDVSLLPLDSLVTDYITKDFGATRVGIFGLTTTQTNEISFPDPAFITDPTAAAARVVPVMEAEGCDVIILLSHLGLRTDKIVAESVPGIDIVIGGHSHTLTPEPVEVVNSTSGESVWIVQAGEHGSHVGKLKFNYIGSYVTITDFDLIPVDEDVPPAGFAEAIINSLVDSLRVDRRFGDVYRNVVAEALIDLEKTPGPGHRKDTPLGNLITDSYRQATGTDIGLTAAGFLAQKIWAGDITEADVFQVVPYGYDLISGLGFRLTTFDITGSEFRKGIEFAIAKAEEDGAFLLQVSGMSFKYDSAREAGDRLFEVIIGGEPIDITRTYSVTVGPFHPIFLTDIVGVNIPEETIEETDFLEYYVVRNYLAAHDPLDSLDARVEGRVIDTLFVEPDLESPAIPAGLTVSGRAGEINLAWSANSEADLWYYTVYRSTTGSFVVADSVYAVFPPDTTWSDSGLVEGTFYYYALAAVDSSGNGSDLSAAVGETYSTGIESGPELPVDFYLSQNYPNPFNPETTIRFGLPRTAHVSIRIYNPAGQVVRTLKNETAPAGNHLVRWDGKDDNGLDASSGIYFFRIDADGFSQTRRMVLLK